MEADKLKTDGLKTERLETDVLVIGAGFAGIMAAVSAAEAGVQVVLASCGATCSGSSFYPGTWGFGLVGPENEKDIPDLADTICRVGEHVADRELVEQFVRGIHPGIEYLRSMGVPLKTAEHAGEREFIPCFDYKNRAWHGIVKETAKPVFLSRLQELEVVTLPHTFITELLQEADGRVCGAAGVRGEVFIRINSKAVVIASGGLGGLFEYRLNPADVTGMGQHLALRAGAELINLEFMQMMPGFLSPAYGTVFNEKIFRYTRSEAFDRWTEAERRRLLELRSGHGPYTSRLESRKVDEAIMEAWKTRESGVPASYDPILKENQPEFVQTYFEWLLKEKGLTPDDPVRLGIFAHASNGGIRIDGKCRTGVPGLYACGEATGGMHGADRLGGLSTANALVFGRIAGAEAAAEAAGKEAAEADQAAMADHASDSALVLSDTFRGAVSEAVSETASEIDRETVREAEILRQELHHRMSRCAMISRTAQQSQKMLDWLEAQAVKWNGKQVGSVSLEAYRTLKHLESEIDMARCMIMAILLRGESRGAHHRDDCQEKNPAMERMIAVSRSGTEIKAQWV